MRRRDEWTEEWRSGENRKGDGMGKETRVESSGEEGIGEESR